MIEDAGGWASEWTSSACCGPISLCFSWLGPPPRITVGLKLPTNAAVFPAHFCVFGCSEHWRKPSLLENLSDKWKKKNHNKCLIAILSPSDHVEFHELFFLFVRPKTKVYTQPLVTGLGRDLLPVRATFHRGKSVSVNQGKYRSLENSLLLFLFGVPDLTSRRLWQGKARASSSTGQGISTLYGYTQFHHVCI